MALFQKGAGKRNWKLVNGESYNVSILANLLHDSSVQFLPKGDDMMISVDGK